MNYEPCKISEIIDEAKNIKTFLLDKDMWKARPGQFVNVWLPWDGLEETGSEKPFSISYKYPLGITVKKSGPFTEKLFEKKENDTLFVRGPIGNRFKDIDFKWSELYNIGGGTGTSPLAFLAEYLHKKIFAIKITSFIGANSKDELVFEKRLKKYGEVHVSTMDGSKGKKGLVTNLFKDYEFPGNSKIAICGPGKMMYETVKILEKKIEPGKIYLSLERLMKCGYGLCGSCSIGKYTVCMDGPVFTYNKLLGTDFGEFKRDRCGRKETL